MKVSKCCNVKINKCGEAGYVKEKSCDVVEKKLSKCKHCGWTSTLQNITSCPNCNSVSNIIEEKPQEVFKILPAYRALFGERKINALNLLQKWIAEEFKKTRPLPVSEDEDIERER